MTPKPVKDTDRKLKWKAGLMYIVTKIPKKNMSKRWLTGGSTPVLFSSSKGLTQIFPFYLQMYYHLHFTHRETEAQRGERTSPRHTWAKVHLMGIYRHLLHPSKAWGRVPLLPSPSFGLPGPLIPGPVSALLLPHGLADSQAPSGCSIVSRRSGAHRGGSLCQAPGSLHWPCQERAYGPGIRKQA